MYQKCKFYVIPVGLDGDSGMIKIDFGDGNYSPRSDFLAVSDTYVVVHYWSKAGEYHLCNGVGIQGLHGVTMELWSSG